jgi:GNAT superfamily N-acetyltransferase
MSTSPGFVIRDGISSDIPACLILDHEYETDHVWQMRLHEEIGHHQITFQTEKLPRTLESSWPHNENRLRLALPDNQCFLVAQDRDHDNELLGYLAMQVDSINQIAQLHDLLISRPYRRNKIGTRLFAVARKWARGHDLMRVTAEVQTRNYPAILFCQQMGLAFCGFNDHYFPNQDIAVFFSGSLR